MSEHPLRRRGDDLEVMVGRIDERTVAMMTHLEKMSGQIAGLGMRLDAVEGAGMRARGAAEERGRWLAIARASQSLIPPAGIAAAVAWAATYFGGPR